MQRVSSDGPELPDLRDQFPHFRIWRETTGSRTRYIARRLRPGIHPHTVVTADLAELGAELSAASAQPRAAQ